MFHVSSASNRESIQAHGLDWTRMSGTRGIAGSRHPEVEGIFLSPDHFTAQFFVRINNTGGPVDIWAVDDVDENDLIDSGNGFSYVPYRIEPQGLTLHTQGLTEDDLPPAIEMNTTNGPSTAYSSSLTIALETGPCFTATRLTPTSINKWTVSNAAPTERTPSTRLNTHYLEHARPPVDRL